MRTLHRYTIRAEISGEIEYDPADPKTYVDALEAVNMKRKGLADLGAKIVHDRSGPVKAREAAEPAPTADGLDIPPFMKK